MSGVALCPLCDCPIQRTSTGTVADGMQVHFGYVHPKAQVPPQISAPSS